MPLCSVRSCKNRSNSCNLSKDGITFHLFKKNQYRKKWIEFCNRPSHWKPTRTSTICSRHFEASQFYSLSKRRLLKDDAIPTLFSTPKPAMPDSGSMTPAGPDSGSATPVTDSEEDEEDDTLVQPEDQSNLSIVVQDPLLLAGDQGSFKQLHSHQPGATHSRIYVQPSASTVIKEEIEEDLKNFKAAYFKLLDEHTALKKQQVQEINKESQAHMVTKKSLSDKIETLVEANRQYVNDVQQLARENQRLLEKNQSLQEKVKYMSNKIQGLTEENDDKTDIREKIDIFTGYVEKIENLNGKISYLTEENKSLVERNNNLAETVKLYSQENQSLEMKNKQQQKFIQSLNHSYNNKLENKSREIKSLRQTLIEFKVEIAALRRKQVT